MGSTYLIHLDKPIHHARHYLGWTPRPICELYQRLGGRDSAALMREAVRLQRAFQLARVWEGKPRSHRLLLRRRKNNQELCPICAQRRSK